MRPVAFYISSPDLGRCGCKAGWCDPCNIATERCRDEAVSKQSCAVPAQSETRAQRFFFER